MQIIENKALLVRTQHPEKFDVLPRKLVTPIPGGAEVLVPWGLDEARVLKNLGVKNVPSPIERTYNWPGRYKPMSHQRVTSGFLTMHRRAFVFNEPGTAKTISALWAADYLMKRGEIRRVLIICPLSIMQTAWANDITNSVIHRSAVVAHHAQSSRRIEMIQGDYEFVIINYDGIGLVADEIKADGRFDLIIVDECFVAGTQVSTPSGQRTIETLTAGEEVLTSNGVTRIKRRICKAASALVKLEFDDGTSTTCTPEHPYFTDAGWLPAYRCAGRRVFRSPAVSDLLGTVLAREAQPALALGERAQQRRDVLQSILRSEAVASSTSRGEPLCTHASGTSGVPAGNSALPGIPSEHVAPYESQRARTETTRGQRDRHDRSGEESIGVSGFDVAVELCGVVGEEALRLSNELQTGLCEPRAEDRLGSGWQLAQHDRPQAARREENEVSGSVGVASVSYIEQGSGTPVYNLELEGTPHFFADGILVHNCNAYANPSTKRWKALAKLLQPDTFLWMMTGTPAAQSPVNAYGLAKLVNPKGVPPFMGAWRDKVMNKITQFKWAPKLDAKDKVFEVLQPAIRFTKAECLDLPPVLKTTREVPMTRQQQQYYDKIKNEMLVVAAGETISAVNKAAVVNKLLQISCGAVYSEGGAVVEFDATPRMNLLLEILEETERKVIIFAMFRSSIDSIVTFLNKHHVPTEAIHGDINATKRADIINRFQHKQDIRVLVMQPQATAHGITLTAADTVVFFGPLMSVELYQQAIARADRKGQTSDKVTVIHIESSPIERKMFAAMDRRVSDHALQAEMFDAEMKEPPMLK